MERTVRLLPKQHEFIEAKEKEILFSGAFRAGKSVALCYKLLEHALIPGNLVLLGRKARVTLKQSTLRTLFDEILPPGSYHHIKSDSIIKLNGGGEIYYFGFDDEQKIGSVSAGAIAIDQAEEINEEEYWMCLGRLSHPADPNPQIFLACNPAAPSHFLFRYFFEEQSPSRRVILTKSDDNVFTWNRYKEIADKFTGKHRERYIMGAWVAFEGLVYEMWDRAIFVRHREGPWQSIIAGVDYGTTNPFAIAKIGFDDNNHAHIMDEVYETNLRYGEMVERCKRIKADVYVVDPSAKGLIMELEAAGLCVQYGEHGPGSVNPGIGHVRDRLSLDANGEPLLTVEPGCEYHIREFESYQWKAGKDEPVKAFDHLMDADRYALTYQDGRGAPSFAIVGATRQWSDNDRENWHRIDNPAFWGGLE